VHSRVRCFQSLPAPSPAIETEHCHCKPVPSRNGDMGHLTKGILVPGVNEQAPHGGFVDAASVRARRGFTVWRPRFVPQADTRDRRGHVS
jgi:hypothetical protein